MYDFLTDSFNSLVEATKKYITYDNGVYVLGRIRDEVGSKITSENAAYALDQASNKIKEYGGNAANSTGTIVAVAALTVGATVVVCGYKRCRRAPEPKQTSTQPVANITAMVADGDWEGVKEASQADSGTLDPAVVAQLLLNTRHSKYRKKRST